jgi:hypothetical protein
MAREASFEQGASELAAMVGNGNLSGVFAVDGGGRTVPLEVGHWRNHMGRNDRVEIRNYHDGGPRAVQNSLENTYTTSLEDIAKTTLVSGPQEGMERHVERMDKEFKVRAPKRTGQYADSTARFVIDNGQPVYERYGTHYGDEPS